MKRTLLIAAFAILMSALLPLFAQQVVTIGTGNDFSYLPFQVYNAYGRSATIYRQSEIGGWGVLTSLAFITNQDEWYPDFAYPVKVYVKKTSSNVFSGNMLWADLLSGTTLVYDGNLSFAPAGWKQMNLSSPYFNYNSDNLMVLVEQYSGIDGTFYGYSRKTDTPGENTCAYGYTGYMLPTTLTGRTTQRANIQLTFEDLTLPVELSSFTATVLAQTNVKLNWVTQSETSLMGYYIYRNTTTDLASAQRISSLVTASNTSNETVYTYEDEEVTNGNTYWYWLEGVGLNSDSEFFGPISIILQSGGEITPPTPTEQTRLLAAYPNPFNPNTSINYYLKDSGSADFTIFNVKGELIHRFVREHKEAGLYHILWDGNDINGNPVSTGVYYCRMNSGKYSSSQKLVLIK